MKWNRSCKFVNCKLCVRPIMSSLVDTTPTRPPRLRLVTNRLKSNLVCVCAARQLADLITETYYHNYNNVSGRFLQIICHRVIITTEYNENSDSSVFKKLITLNRIFSLFLQLAFFSYFASDCQRTS